MTFKARGLYACSSKVQRRPRTGLWLLLGAALALVAATVLSVLGNTAINHEQASDTFQSQGRVEVDNRTSGSVEITTADVDQVHIERTLDTSPLREVDESIDHTGQGAHIQAHCPGPDLFLTTCAADYDITLPAQSHVQIHTTSGQILASGLQGPMQAHSTSGRIQIQDHQGPARAQTTSGDINLTGQNVQADSTSGNVGIGDFTDAEASSVSGNIQIHSNQQLHTLTVDTTSGNVTAQVPDQDYDLSGSSTSGDRQIGVDTSPQAHAQITIDTVSGSVELSRP